MNKVTFNGQEFTRNGKVAYSHAWALVSPSGKVLTVGYTKSAATAEKSGNSEAVWHRKNSTAHKDCTLQTAACE